MSSNSIDYSHLKELGNSKYEIADGESDIRNWVVKNEKGNILGEVQDLILDTKARKVQFIVLDLNRNELNLKERKVLLPLEYADIHEAYKNVVYKGLMPNELAALPTYEKGNINRNSLDLTMSTFIASMNNDVAATPNPPSNFRGAEVRNDQRQQPVAEITAEGAQNTGSVETGKSYTVVGVFEHANQTQAAVEYLLDNGFRREEIRVYTRHGDTQHEQNNRNESGITDFFGSLFNNDDDARKYSDAASRGSVVSVEVSSKQQANEAAEILDQHGAMDVNAEADPALSKKGNSRIWERNTRR